MAPEDKDRRKNKGRAPGEERRRGGDREDPDYNYHGPQRRNTDAHIEKLEYRIARVHDDLKEMRQDLTKYVLRVEILPLKLVVFGGVGFILLGVIAALLLTILKAQ